MFSRYFSDPVSRRLLPLYAARFFEAIVLWYAIEKIYMTSIGFDATLIGVAVAVMAAGILLFEVPFGVLADKWSRKGVLVIAILSLTAASVTFGLAQSVWPYILAGLFYSIYNASHSGTIDSIIYDALLEENGSRKGFEKYYGRAHLVNGVGLVLAGFMSSVVVSFDSVRSTYFWTIIPMALAALSLYWLKEPQLHRIDPAEKLVRQFKAASRAVFKHKILFDTFIFMTLILILMEVFYEMDQLWALALAMPLVWYGPLNSWVVLGHALGGPLAPILAKHLAWLRVTILLLPVALFFLQVKNMWVIAGVFFVGLALLNAFYIFGQGIVHDGVSSNIRSSAMSVVSMASNAIMLPTIIIFGKLIDRFDIFAASVWLLPVGLLLAVVGLLLVRPSRQSRVL